MTSAQEKIANKLGEKVQERSAEARILPELEDTEKQAITEVLRRHGFPSVVSIVDDLAVRETWRQMLLDNLSESTRVEILYCLHKLCRDITKTPRQLVEEAKNMDRMQRLQFSKNLALTYIDKLKLSPGTASSMYYAWRKLLQANNIDIQDLRKPFKVKRRSIQRRLTDKDAQDWYLACQNDRHRLAVTLIVEGGCRINVVCKLTFGHILQPLREGKQRFTVTIENDKGNRQHPVIITERATMLIKRITEELEKRGIEIGPEMPLVSTYHNPFKRHNPGDLATILRKVMRRTGLNTEIAYRGDSPKSIRYSKGIHTSPRKRYKVNATKKGGNLDAIEVTMGHIPQRNQNASYFDPDSLAEDEMSEEDLLLQHRTWGVSIFSDETDELNALTDVALDYAKKKGITLSSSKIDEYKQALKELLTGERGPDRADSQGRVGETQALEQKGEKHLEHHKGNRSALLG